MAGSPTNELASVHQATARVNVSAIADLLSNFNGGADNFGTWEKQVHALKTAYQLNDDMTRILIGMRLKGKALE